MTPLTSTRIIFLITGTLIVYWSIYPLNSSAPFKLSLYNIALNVFAGVLLFYLIDLLQNIKQPLFFLKTRLFYRNTDIRLSIAYLFRIKVEDKYLLVKSRTRNYFQPVGGAFKTLPGSEKIFEKLEVKPDRLIETEKGIAKGDLRIYVKGKNVIDFLHWFDSKEDRETSPWREFCEELLSTKILPQTEFRYIDYKFKGKIQSPIYRLQSGDLGLFMFEIYDLVINDEQKTVLEKLLANGNTQDYVWANESLIQRLGHDPNQKQYQFDISPHTKWALEMKWARK